jgi:hypothetical protein
LLGSVEWPVGQKVEFQKIETEHQNYFLQKVKTISYRRPKLLKNLAKDQNSHFVEDRKVEKAI